jgi:hypothetical protein
MIFSKKGQIALSFVLLVSGVIVEIVIAGSLITYFLSNSGLGERMQSRAATAAYSGVWDALSRISRSRDFASGGSVYGLAVNGDSVTVDVSRISDDGANSYVFTISSLGVAVGRERNLIAIAVVNKTTGQVQLQSLVDHPI